MNYKNKIKKYKKNNLKDYDITFNDNKKSDHLNIKEMQDFININLNMDLINSNYKPHKSLNPKISVIIFNL